MSFPHFLRSVRSRPALAAGLFVLTLLAIGGLGSLRGTAPSRDSQEKRTPIAQKVAAKAMPERLRVGLRRPSRQPIVEMWLGAPARLRDGATGAALTVLPAGKRVVLRARADWDMVACSAPGVTTARPSLRL